MRVKYMKVKDGERIDIDRFPNIHVSGSVKGMKSRFWGEDALLVRCGSWIFNVTREPSIYHDLAY